MEIEYIPIDDLEITEYNPRKLSDNQFNQIKESLERFGFVDPVVRNINPDRYNVVVGGAQRCKVAKSLGYEKAPTTPVNLDIDKEKELNIRLNKNTGQWDFNLLEQFFNEDDLIDWGFGEEELPWIGDDLKDFFNSQEEDQGGNEGKTFEKIVFELTPEQAENVRNELAKWDKTPENAILKMMGFL